MKPTSRTTRILGALLCAAMLAACSGNSPSSSSLPSTQTPFKWNGKVGKLTFRLKVPGKKRQAEIAQLLSHGEAAGGKKPHYFPASATTLAFKLLKINGTLATQPTPYNFAVALSSCAATTPFACTVTGGIGATVNCSQSPPTTGPWGCTIHTNAPAAPDAFLIESEDTTSGTKVLSESTLAITVAAGGSPSGTFTLDPLVSKMVWSSGWISDNASSGGGNGPTEPTWNGAAYTCPSAPGTFCSDPLVNGNNVATNDTLTLSFQDSDGNTVLGVTGSPTSPSGRVPIFVNGSGVELNVNVSCNNADLQWVNGSGATPVTYATLTGATPSATPNPGGYVPNPFLANGASSSFTGALTDFVGNGNPNASNLPQINSPETDTDGTGVGTDGSGNLSSDVTWSNNGAYINYDGGGNATSGATSWTCTAAGNGVATVKYYVGLAEGSISGLRRRPIKIH